MTKEELLKKLRDMKRDPKRDYEQDHIDADQLLLEFINDPEVTAAFEAIGKYYA